MYAELIKVKDFDLPLICDTFSYDDDDMVIVKFNATKVRTFLQSKFNKACKALHSRSVGENTVVATGFNLVSKTTASINNNVAIATEGDVSYFRIAAILYL